MNMQKSQPAAVVLNPQEIVQCVGLIVKGQMIKESHEYLANCEKNCEFALVLFQIFDRLDDPALSVGVYHLATNVIKRNWQSHRRGSNASNRKSYVVSLEPIKTTIKAKVLAYCQQRPARLNWKSHKELVKFLSEIEYPKNWPDLQLYMLSILEQVYKSSSISDTLLQSLDLLLAVMKGESRKSVLKKGSSFQTHILPIAQPVQLMLEALNAKLDQVVQSKVVPGVNQIILSSTLDRILLSCLQNLPLNTASNPEVSKLIKQQLAKSQLYLSMFQLTNDDRTRQLLGKCIKRVIFYTRLMLMNHYLLFEDFLADYLKLLLGYLEIVKEFRRYDPQNKIQKSILLSFIKILQTYMFYAKDEEYRESIFYRKVGEANQHIVISCRNQFHAFFSEPVIEKLLQFLITHIIGKKEPESEEELEEEEQLVHNDISNSLYSIGSSLVYYLLERFKAQTSKLIGAMLDNLVNNQFQMQPQLQNNIYLTLLVLPKVFTEPTELPMAHILSILSHCHSQPRYHRIFALLSAKYMQMLDEPQLQNVFDALIDLTVCSKDHIVIYESARSISLILNKYIDVVKLTNLGKTLLVLVGMLSKFKNPSSTRMIINLVNKILENCNFEQQILMQCLSSAEVQALLQTKSQILIYQVSELLENIMKKVPKQEIILMTLVFVNTHIRMELDSAEVIYKLWLTAVKCYQLGGVLESHFRELFVEHREDLEEVNSQYFCEILKEYLMLGIITLQHQEISVIVSTIVSEHNQQSRKPISCAFSLYFVYLNLQQHCVYNPNMVQLAFQQLCSIDASQLSGQKVELQASIVDILNKLIINNTQEFVLLTTKLCGSTQWMEIWHNNSKNLYVNSSEKLNTLAHILMLNYFQPETLFKHFESIMQKSMVMLGPLEPQPKLYLSTDIKLSRRKQTLLNANPHLKNDHRALLQQKFKLLCARYPSQIQQINKLIKSDELMERINQLMMV